ncbi:MAG: hypothetical protein ACREEB_09080 [Caulobacteraceae bacterium]
MRLRPPFTWFPRSPDLSGAKALLVTTLVVGVAVCVVMALSRSVMPGFRDTDDATRLIMVRALADGRGWYDQAIARFDPPHGLWMHWSRLLDGGIAGMILLLRQFMSPASAEYWTRYLWPLIWVFPATGAALALARNLGGRSATFLAAALLLVDPDAYRQFVPGRIDHHDIQIVMAVVAMACATARRDRTRWAALGGAAAGLGLAIGLEAMPLQALIGASFGVNLMREARARGPAAAYGLALALTTGALFLIQTPPWRWSMSFCDALALNLTVAILIAGLGLTLAAWAAKWAGPTVRVGYVLAAGGAALVAYLAIDPQCIHGPFAAMNPAVRSFWFDHIQEVQPLNRMMLYARGPAIDAAVLLALSLASALYLAGRRWRETSPLLMLAAMILATITAWFAWRMQDYVYWLGLPAFAAALSWIGERRWRDLLVPGAALAVALSPAVAGAAVDAAVTALTPRHGPRFMNAGPRCFARQAYAPLAALPTGDVLATQDLGPFIVVFTHHSAVVAPYHRMSDVILAAHQAWNAPPAAAEAKVRALGADYLVDCPPYPVRLGSASLGMALRRGRVPPWLRRLSPPKAALQIYRVLPPAAQG